MKVKNFMSAPAITIDADATLKEIVHLLSSHQISGVPVVDDDGKLIGMISWHELFPSVKNIRPPDVRIPVLFNEIVDLKNMVDSYKQFAHFKARHLMSPSPVCVDADDPIGHVVWTMVQNNLYIIPVLSGDALVGVLTRRDFIRFLAQEL